MSRKHNGVHHRSPSRYKDRKIARGLEADASTKMPDVVVLRKKQGR